MKKGIIFILSGGLFGFLGSLIGYRVAKKKYLLMADMEIESMKANQPKHDESLLKLYGITPEKRKELDAKKPKEKKPVDIISKEHQTHVDYAKPYAPTVENPKNPVVKPGSEVCLITEQEFEDSEYTPQSLYYYAKDRVIADVDGNAIANYKELIGPEELWKKDVCGGAYAAYVKNNTSEIDYEVLYRDEKWENIASPTQKSARFTELNSESDEDDK